MSSALVPHQAAQTPRYDVPLQTQRSVAMTTAVDQLLHSPAASARRVVWMGPTSVVAVDVDAHDPILDVQARIASRNRRKKMIRELEGFLDHVKQVLNGGEQQQQQQQQQPAEHQPTESKSKESQPAAATENGAASSSTAAKPAAAAAKEEVIDQSLKYRVDRGEILLSAYDSSAHEDSELVAFNAFVHEYMVRLVRDEEHREQQGEYLSVASGADGRSTRRPTRLPDIDHWNRLPPAARHDPENPDQYDLVLAARREYNAAALHESRLVTGYRCFRKIDFGAAFDQQTASNSPPQHKQSSDQPPQEAATSSAAASEQPVATAEPAAANSTPAAGQTATEESAKPVEAQSTAEAKK